MKEEAIRMLQAREAEIMKPVNDRVTNTITDVGKERGVSLVLNSHHIMWGGRNLTDDVMKKLVNGPAKS
jgi:outer membrane protein